MSKKKKITLIVLISLIVLLAIGAAVYFLVLNPKSDLTSSEATEEKVEQAPEKKINIYSGNERPFAVMIDNVGDALPQAGTNSAYIVYEITVEGSLTRLMGLFKGVDLNEIGPVRSSRHYFLDYALENDAIYVHYGWSPQAESDISSLKVNNINGMTAPSGIFNRTSKKESPHDVLTGTQSLKKGAENYGYRTTSDAKSILNYVPDEVELENGEVANIVNIPYSSTNKVSFKYNAETKRYEKYIGGKLQKEFTTGNTITTKNIIVTFAKNYALNDGSGKDRQGLNNVGNLDGYYITNGKYIPIVCSKSSRTAQTVYKDKAGKEIEVNDGNTYIQICPLDLKVTFE